MAKKKKKNVSGTINNRRARFDYDIKESYMAGIVLSGPETHSLRVNHGSLNGAYVTIKDNEVVLINATIMPTKTNASQFPESDQTRSRKLLLKRREIEELAAAKQQGLTIVPLRFLTAKRYIKVEIAVGRGKKHYDKRETLKQRDQDKDARRMISRLSR